MTLVVAAIAVALLAVGCGQGDDSGASAKSISKKEFIAKADAICDKSTERMQVAIAGILKGQPNLTKVSKGEQEKIATTVMAPSVRREVKELRALGVPKGDEEKIDAMISALEEGFETAERDPAAVANSSDAVFGIASRIAAEYGLEACGSR